VPDRLLKIPAILERGVSVFDAFGVGVYCVDLEGLFTYVNPAGETLLGWGAGELRGRHAHDTIHHSHPDGTAYPREECEFYGALERGATERELDDVFWSKSETPVEVAHTIAPLHENGKHISAIVVFVDVRGRRHDTALLHRRAAQQAALAELGLLALGGGSLDGLFDKATALVKETLNVDLAQAFELDPEARCLRLRAGVGLRPGLVGVATVETGRRSLAGFTVERDQPVVVEDLRTEWRFRTPPFLLEHGVVSGLTVVIHRGGRRRGTVPWGVLGAHTRSPRAFTQQDINFLHTVANTLGLAIERNNAEHKLRQRNREIAKLADKVSTLADDRRRIMADALDAEDRTRERISQLLHDEVLQSLLTARQDLAKLKPTGGGQDNPASQAREAIVGAIHELRNAVVALHPVTLEQGGLASALKANRRHARQSQRVRGDAGGRAAGRRHTRPADRLARAGAAEQRRPARTSQPRHRRAPAHARGNRVPGGRRRSRNDPARPREALDLGHVGLASVAMRVESLGGTFQITSSPGEGTRVQTVIPVETPHVRGGRSSVAS
jgi:PAS domain S-box-containing protein